MSDSRTSKTIDDFRCRYPNNCDCCQSNRVTFERLTLERDEVWRALGATDTGQGLVWTARATASLSRERQDTVRSLMAQNERLRARLTLETAALEQACAAPVDRPITVQAARAAVETPAAPSGHQSEYPLGFMEGFVHASTVLVSEDQTAVYRRADHYRNEIALMSGTAKVCACGGTTAAHAEGCLVEKIRRIWPAEKASDRCTCVAGKLNWCAVHPENGNGAR